MENSIKDIINNSLEQVRSVVDADTVIGQAIRTDSGTMIIPVSKISVGMATGGLDIPAKGEGVNKNFGGGGGTGVSVSPIGFLTIYPTGAVEMLPIAPAHTSPIEQIADIIDRTPDVIARIKSVFSPFAAEEEDAAIAAEAMAAAEAAEAAAAAEALAAQVAEEVPLSKKEAKKLEKAQKKEAKKAAKEAKKNK